MGERPTSIEVEQDDRELLARFVEGRDEQAFSELVARHGRMALGVCRRVLGDSSEADDAFQATFLVLIARAEELHGARGGVRSLGGWLHRVAANASLQLVRESKSRMRRESAFARSRSVSSGDSPMQEALPILDEELRRLPDRYRSPLVLCYFQDQSQQAAADSLGISYATLRRRLERGREMLRNRLSHRGCTIAPALFGAILWESAAFADRLGPDSSRMLATPLLESSEGSPLGLGGISSRSVRLSRKVLRIMRNQMIRRSAGLLLILLFCASTGLIARDVIASDSPKPVNGTEAARNAPANSPRQARSEPAPSSKPDAKAAGPKAQPGKPQAKPGKDVPAIDLRKSGPPEIDQEADPFPPSVSGQSSEGFHGSIMINGQARDFDNQEEYEKALRAMAGGPVADPTPKNQPRPANPAAAPKKAGSASKNRRNTAKSARPQARAARPNNLAQPNTPGFVGFQYEMEFGTGVPGGFAERGMTFSMPGIPGMPGLPGLNRAPRSNGPPPAVVGGGVDGFDNGVGGPVAPGVEGKDQAGKTQAKDKAKDASPAPSAKSARSGG